MEQVLAFDKALAFIQEIGIPVLFQSIESPSFLPGLRIQNGSIIIDKAQLKFPGDILHEAGHIAVVPAADRPTLSEAAIAERKDRAAEEMMAIAWSFCCLCTSATGSYICIS
jgi:hypothetical protein